MAEKASPSREEILTAFAAFDKDHSGTVTRDEFVAILTRRVPGKPPPIAAAEAERQFSLFDKNGDGVISFEGLRARGAMARGPLLLPPIRWRRLASPNPRQCW